MQHRHGVTLLVVTSMLLGLLLGACGGGDDAERTDTPVSDPSPTSAEIATSEPTASSVVVSTPNVPASPTSGILAPTATVVAGTATPTTVVTPAPTTPPIATATPRPIATAVTVVSKDEAFSFIWGITDRDVASGRASYSWFWGPEWRDQRSEAYAESPGGEREVRYYDKSRMEINDPGGDPLNIYYVTNGLLTIELVTGRMQIGNSDFEQRDPATALVAGDPQNNPGTPSYAAFAPFATTDGESNRAQDRTGQAVTEFLAGDGTTATVASDGVTLASYQDATGHNIASAFWSVITSLAAGYRPAQGVDWLYVLGYPISEPYWIDATVEGTTKRVLVQLFERRVLTYTPSNADPYKVEFGNIGLHYHSWRYGE